MSASKDASKPDRTVVKKPSRPYTEYNLFFQLEREVIVQSLPSTHLKLPTQKPNSLYHDPQLPQRYRSLVLAPNWYVSGRDKPKRKHRKTPGMIGFQELSRLIAQRWAYADDETKHYCRSMADVALGLYKRKMKAYNDATGKAIGKPEKNKKTREHTTTRGRGQASGARLPCIVSYPSILSSTARTNLHQENEMCSKKNVCTFVSAHEPFHNDRSDNRELCYQCNSEVEQPRNSKELQDDIDLFLSTMINEEVSKPPCSSIHSNSSTMSRFSDEIDMMDEEIMQLWNNLAAEEKQ